MKFCAINRMLVVESILDDDEKPTKLLVPDGVSLKPFTICKIVDAAPDCQGIYNEDQIIAVRTHGLEEVKFKNKTYTIIAENFVVGEFFSDE